MSTSIVEVLLLGAQAAQAAKLRKYIPLNDWAIPAGGQHQSISIGWTSGLPRTWCEFPYSIEVKKNS